MHFINPWFLWFGGLIAIPFLLNLWRKKKVKDIKFSYFNLLIDSKIKNFTRIKIFNILLLLLRVLLLVFLIILMARPVFRGAVLSDAVSPDSVVVYAIDNSRSMDCVFKGTSLLKKAKQIVADNILALPITVNCALIFMNDQGETKIIKAESNPEKLLTELKNIHIQNFRFNPQKVFSVAGDFFSRWHKEPKKLLVYTDNQWRNWGDMNKVDVLEEVGVSFVVPSGMPTNGVGFVGYKLQNRLAKANSKHAVVGMIRNFGRSEIKDLIIRFFIDDKMVDETLVSIPSDKTIDRTFFYRSSTKTQKARLVIDYPDFSIDNELKLVLPVYENKTVCILGEKSVFVDTVVKTYFSNDDRFIKYDKSIIEGDMFVVPDYKDGMEADVLDKLYLGGCGIVFYPPDKISEETSIATVEKVVFDHPVLSPYRKMGEEGFEAIRYFPNKSRPFLDQINNRNVLLADKNGNVLLEELIVNKGRLFVFNTDSKGRYSNIVNTEYFLPIFHRILDYFLVYNTGLPDSFIREIGSNYYVTDKKSFTLKWVKPNGTILNFSSIFVDGVYRVETIRPSFAGYHKFIKDDKIEKIVAFNLPLGEGDLTVVSKKRLSGILTNNAIDYIDMFTESSPSRGNNNVIKILVLLCVLLSLCELIVANMSG